MSTEFPNIDFKIPDIAAGRVIPHSVERMIAEEERRNEELEAAKREAKKAKRYNIIMLIISVVSLLVAVAAWVLPEPAEIIKMIGWRFS